jgi:hypothetical protein
MNQSLLTKPTIHYQTTVEDLYTQSIALGLGTIAENGHFV